MNFRLAFALISAVALLAAVFVATAAHNAAAHGCHYYCSWPWADDGSGGGWWCGADHNGDIVYRWDGNGFKCNWNALYGPLAPQHSAYWNSGY